MGVLTMLRELPTHNTTSPFSCRILNISWVAAITRQEDQTKGEKEQRVRKTARQDMLNLNATFISALKKIAFEHFQQNKTATI
jgi:hypothetical protein